jgi:hypothetical protein
MIIGNNTLLGTIAAFNFPTAKKLSGVTQEAVLLANQRLIGVHVGWGPGNGNAAGSIKVCLYDQGNASANKPKISGTEITISYDASTLGSASRWVSVTGLSIDLSAHEGKTLCPGIAGPAASSNSGFSVLLATVSGALRTNSTTPTVTNPDPFVASTTSANQAWSVYFETETIDTGGPAPAIDSVGTAGVVHVGATENISTTGLDDLTSATIGGTAAAAISAVDGDGTITLADFVDGVVYPAMGVVTVAVSDGSASASKTDAVLTTKTGWQYVNVSGLSSSEFSLGKAFGGGDVPTQMHAINDGTGVLNADGTLTNWAVGTYTAWARMAAGTYTAGTMKRLTFTVHQPIDLSSSSLVVAADFTQPTLTQNYFLSSNDLTSASDFSSPSLTQNQTLSIASLTVSTVITEPSLSQANTVLPADFLVSVQLGSPVLSAAGYMQVDDLYLATAFSNPGVFPAVEIVVNDLTVVVSLSLPVVGDIPNGPYYSNKIVQIFGTKLIVQIIK